jgi:glycosyltransferase involved in cell wall biosynthesis
MRGPAHVHACDHTQDPHAANGFGSSFHPAYCLLAFGRVPIRVLQVLARDAFGGTEQMVATLASSLDPARVHCEVATLDRAGPVATRLDDAGVRVWSLGGGASGFARLARRVRREGYDVVNAYGFKPSLVCRLVTPRSRTAVVVGVRGQHVADVLCDPARIDSRLSRLVLAAERATQRRVDAYDANSQGAAELLAGAGIQRERIRVIPNGVDLGRFASRERPVGSAPVVRIVCVARMTPIKRHVDLLEAAAALARGDTPFELVLVGGGEMLDEVRVRTRELGLESHVQAPGALDGDGVRTVLAGSDVFCLPSLSEGQPGSVMEAMASGLPVVGTDVNGTRDVVVHGVTGLLVPAGQPDELASALAELVADRARMAALGAAGRDRIASEFTLERMVERKQDLYLELAERA